MTTFQALITGLGALTSTDPATTTQINALWTIANTLSLNTPTVSPVKKLGSPDKFHGNTKEDVDAWLQHMEMFCTLSGMNAQEKLAYAVFFLRGHAMKWHQTLQVKPQTWDDFSAKLLVQFQPVNPVTTACDDMDKLH